MIHLAFGEAGLPVHPVLREMLDAASSRNSYPPVAGTVAARAAAAGYFQRRGVNAEPDSVMFAPGSKPILFALMVAIEGDLLLPQPSWVSYAAQAHIAGKRVVSIPIADSAGGIPSPDALRDWAARHQGAPATLLLTTPDNPTGTVAGAELLEEVCAIARENRWWVISDEIYSDLAYDPASFTSPAKLIPEQTVVTTGMSKNLALGGWRIGVSLFPSTGHGRELRTSVDAIASDVWSAMAAPMQDVAAFALGEPEDLRAFVSAARGLHRTVTLALYEKFAERGITARRPAGGFYFYPDFGAHQAKLAADGVDGSESLASHLIDRNVAVLPGTAFGDHPQRLTARVAASLLYGKTDDERWAALNAVNATELPWIAGALDRVGAALDDLLGL